MLPFSHQRTPDSTASTPSPGLLRAFAAVLLFVAVLLGGGAAWAQAIPGRGGDPAAVTPPAEGSDNALFDSQSVPTTMVVGQGYDVSVTMRNTGSEAWTDAANYRGLTFVNTTAW